MDSIYGNSIKPNEKAQTKNKIDLLRKMGRGIPRGSGFGRADACECFRCAPDAGTADILKNHKNLEIVIHLPSAFPPLCPMRSPGACGSQCVISCL